MQPADENPVVLDVTRIAPSTAQTQGCDEGALMAQVAAGDRVAAEQLVRTYQATVRGFLSAVCYDRQAVDDLGQETFLRAIRHAERFDPGYPLRGWLFTIARRLSINHGNKAKRRRPAPGIELNQLPQPSTNQTPSQRLEEDEQQQLTKDMIQDAMQQLTEPQRVAIAMHYQQGLAVDDIATLLEMPAGTVKSHLHRGRKRMHELLEPQAARLMS